MYMKKILLASICIMIFAPCVTFAKVEGKNAAKTYVEMHAKHGGSWFTARKIKTDKHSVIKVKDVISGKYKFTIEDQKSDQKIGLKMRVRDEKGRKITKKVPVNVYAYAGDTRILIGVAKTNNKGWFGIKNASPDVVYEIEVKKKGSLKSKNDQARVKTKMKIEDGRWFYASYDRLEKDETGKTNGTLELKNVMPGKYKFKVKSGDPYDYTKPMTVKAKVLRKNGKKVKKPMRVEVYAYVHHQKQLVAELTTDDKGWVTLTDVQPNTKYRIKVRKNK